jgi:hypothetical protein
MLLVGGGLSSRVLAVDEQLHGRVLVGLHFLNDCLVESVHVEFIKNYSSDQWFRTKFELDALLQNA